MKEMGLFLMAQAALNSVHQFFLLHVIGKKVAQRNAILSEQTQMQIPDGGYPQTVATGTKLFFIGHDKPDFTDIIRVAEDLCRAIATGTNLQLPALGDQLLTQDVAGNVVFTEQRAAVTGFHQFNKAKL